MTASAGRVSLRSVEPPVGGSPSPHMSVPERGVREALLGTGGLLFEGSRVPLEHPSMLGSATHNATVMV